MKPILVQAHELAIAHGISIEAAIAMLDTLEGEDIFLISHFCSDSNFASTKDKDKWTAKTLSDEDWQCPECGGSSPTADEFFFEKAKLFPCEYSSYTQYLKNRDRPINKPLRDGDRIIYEWEVPEDYPRDRDRLDDIAEAYCVAENEKAASGIICWAKYHGEWECNPTGTRPLIKHLLERLGTAIASQQNQLRG